MEAGATKNKPRTVDWSLDGKGGGEEGAAEFGRAYFDGVLSSFRFE